MISNIILIGAGGLSTHLIHSLTNIANVHIFDGDKYEEKNISRQHYANGNIGKNKAEVMAESVGAWSKNKVTYTPTYLRPEADCSGDLIIAAVDNHDARITSKYIADQLFIPMIMGMNEEYDPQSYLYLPQHAGTDLDPFVYGNILPDGRDPSASCTGEIMDDGNNVQTALANTVAAGFVLAILHSLMVTPEEHEAHITAKIIATNNTVWSKTFFQLQQDLANV